jgi:hypothetical protein
LDEYERTEKLIHQLNRLKAQRTTDRGSIVWIANAQSAIEKADNVLEVMFTNRLRGAGQLSGQRGELVFLLHQQTQLFQHYEQYAETFKVKAEQTIYIRSVAVRGDYS